MGFAKIKHRSSFGQTMTKQPIATNTTSLLLQRLGIQYPIFKAPMAGVSTPQLAAIVSNAGGLGAIAIGASSTDAARKMIQDTKRLTDKPFNVNVFCHETLHVNPEQEQAWIDYLQPYFVKYGQPAPTQLHEIYPSFIAHAAMTQLLLEERPAVVSFHFGLPNTDQIAALKAAGILLFATATNLQEVRLIEQAGIDAIVAQGVEAGGHRGIFNPYIDAAITTIDLVTLLKANTTLPIIAAGGIMNGADIQQILALGADAAQLGTAFVICEESAASATYRTHLMNPAKQRTQITQVISGRPARGLINQWHTMIDNPQRPLVAPYPYAYDIAKQLNTLVTKQEDDNFSVFWAGTQVHRIQQLNAQALMASFIESLV